MVDDSPNDSSSLDATTRQPSANESAQLRELVESTSSKLPKLQKPIKAIERYRTASPCGAVWDEMKGSDRVRFCERCELQVYDFSGMDLPETEQVIFFRENKTNAVLYKTKNGKFISRDCPLGIRRRRSFILMIAALALVLIGSVTMLCLQLANRPLPTATTNGSVGASTTRKLPGVTAIFGSAKGSETWVRNVNFPISPAVSSQTIMLAPPVSPSSVNAGNGQQDVYPGNQDPSGHSGTTGGASSVVSDQSSIEAQANGQRSGTGMPGDLPGTPIRSPAKDPTSTQSASSNADSNQPTGFSNDAAPTTSNSTPSPDSSPQGNPYVKYYGPPTH